jgi:hypothetical protein
VYVIFTSHLIYPSLVLYDINNNIEFFNYFTFYKSLQIFACLDDFDITGRSNLYIYTWVTLDSTAIKIALTVNNKKTREKIRKIKHKSTTTDH